MVINKHDIYIMQLCMFQNLSVIFYHILQSTPLVIQSFFNDIPILLNIREMLSYILFTHYKTIALDIL